MWRSLSFIYSFLGLVLLLGSQVKADATLISPNPSPAFAWNTVTQGKFVLAMTRDTQGGLWFGGDNGQGLWRYAPASGLWRHFSASTQVPGNVYALACDKQGRVWAGTLNQGVFVWNGWQWQNYDVTNGPLGSRVFAIAVCPTSGDVWMATEAGLARWSVSKDTWTYYTREEGLPSDQASCLAFDRLGNLFVGTQCDGLAVGSAISDYKHWRNVKGWDPMPLAPGGDGLPSNLINALLITQSGTIYAGTTHGLAHSSDGGKTWRFLRGADWQMQGRGLYHAVALLTADTKGHLLLEDYVTSLAEDKAGDLAIGYRTKGYEVVNPAGNRLYPAPKGKPNTNFVTGLMFTGSHLLVGTYGNSGLIQTQPVSVLTAEPEKLIPESPIYPNNAPRLPSPAKTPTIELLHAMRAQVQGLQDTLPVGGGTYLCEDWQTEGDAIGHYGRQYARLFAIASPLDQKLTWNMPAVYDTDAQMGPHRQKGDLLRHWISFSHTQNRNALYSPVDGFRTQAEIDDHGEAYAGLGFGGPDIWITVKVPEGIHRVSLYFYNKDGHIGSNRYRDYMIELKNFKDNLADVERSPALASARVKDFSGGGVYKSFIIRGPNKYYLKISKNNSHNTICSGVFIDKLMGPQTKEDKLPLAFMGTVHYDPYPDIPDKYSSPPTDPNLIAAAKSLYTTLDASYSCPNSYGMQIKYRTFAYRAIMSAHPRFGLLEQLRWQLHLWNEDDRSKFDNFVKSGHYDLIHPGLRPIQ